MYILFITKVHILVLIKCSYKIEPPITNHLRHSARDLKNYKAVMLAFFLSIIEIIVKISNQKLA